LSKSAFPLPSGERIKVRGKHVNLSDVCELQQRREFKMSQKILFCTLFILIFLIPSKQDSNAKTWERHNTTVQANSILAAIDSGYSIIIDSCEIVDPLVKRGTPERPDTIKGIIWISNSTFHDQLFFSYCYFLNFVDFEMDTFNQDLDFSPTDLIQKFSNNIYSRRHFLLVQHTLALAEGRDWKCTFFRKGVSFWHSIFRNYANLSATAFHGVANFEGTNFDTHADFIGTTFGAPAIFLDATFGGFAVFAGSTFDTIAVFENATFHDDAFFEIDTFGGEADFRDAGFDTNVYFDGAVFRGKVSFLEATFGGDVKLSEMRFTEIDISWKQLDGHLTCDVLTSYKLMKYFEEQRQLENADGVYLFLKDQERIEKKWYIEYPEYWFIQQTCGYGVKPLRTLIVCGLVIILFSALYTKSNAIKEIEKELGHQRRRKRFRIVRKGFRKRFYDALYFSVHTFIIGIVSNWHPTDEFLIKTKRIRLFKFRTLSMIEGALGWVLLVLFVVTLTRKFIR
jgi:uncharacterized protein YjbI with pentapeptide repeats